MVVCEDIWEAGHCCGEMAGEGRATVVVWANTDWGGTNYVCAQREELSSQQEALISTFLLGDRGTVPRPVLLGINAYRLDAYESVAFVLGLLESEEVQVTSIHLI